MLLYSNTCNAIGYIELILYSLPLEVLTRSGVVWRTRLESFLRQSVLVSLSSVCMLSFYFLHEQHMFSYWVNRE